jgi:hypothetical protein
MYISIKHMNVTLGLVHDKIGIEIYSIRAPATRASKPPETRLATPALAVGTVVWAAVVEAAALELSGVSLGVSLGVALAEVLEAVVMVGELVGLDEAVLDSSEVVVRVALVDDSVVDSLVVDSLVELAEEVTETVEPSTVKRPM